MFHVSCMVQVKNTLSEQGDEMSEKDEDEDDETELVEHLNSEEDEVINQID